jgi:hypothetical protein
MKRAPRNKSLGLPIELIPRFTSWLRVFDMKTAKSKLVLRLSSLAIAVCLQGASILQASTSNVKVWGARGDTKVISDGGVASGSTILASLSYEFVPADQGKTILVIGAGPSGSNLVTSISSVIDPAHITLAAAADVAVESATVYWGTDDSAAIATAIRAISNSGGTLFFPSGTYLNRATLRLPNSTTMQGEGRTSWLVGDPGAVPLVQAANVHDVVVTAIRLSNVHTKRGAEYGYSTVQLNQATDSAVMDAWISYGRPAIQLSRAERIRIENNEIDAARDFAISASMSGAVEILRNTITNSVTTGVLGPPHDINLEDTDDSLVDGNQIRDGEGVIEAGASCLQLYPNHNPSVSNVRFSNNVCIKTGGNMLYGFTGGGPGAYKMVQFVTNRLSGYHNGVWFSGARTNTFSGVNISRNVVVGAEGYGIGIGGADGESVASVEITFNDIHLSSQMDKSAFGIHANRLRHLLVYGNTVTHFGDGGIELVGVSDSTICFNRSLDQSTGSRENGILVEQWNPSMTSANNRIENNSLD